MVERRAPPWADAHGRDERGVWAVLRVAGVTQRFRWIAPGPTAMGSPDTEAGRAPQEGPARIETVPAGFWLAETPVTGAWWRAMEPSHPGHDEGPQRPITCVSWNDAQHHLAHLNTRVPGLDARLPTEREWERACRAGTSTATWVGDLTLFDGQSPELAPIAWYAANSGGATHDVGTRAANPWGLYDMLGNVWEWCADAYAPWRAKPKRVTAKTKEVPPEKTLRTIRGGSFRNRADVVRAAMRGAFLPDVRDACVGFRVALGGGDDDTR